MATMVAMAMREALDLFGPYAALVAAALAGVFLIASRRPDRLRLVSDAAWQLKGEAEKETAEKERRIVQLEADVATNTQRLVAAEAKYHAAIEAQQLVHVAEVRAQAVLHEAERERSDRVIARLTLKIEDLERRLDAARPVAAAQ